MDAMKPLSTLLFLTLVLVLPLRLDAGQGIALNNHVQDGLIAAEPVRGPGVDRELFNGKPVLVVFFASW